MMTDELGDSIELLSNTKAKLEVAELVLKTLHINYEIVPPKPHTSKSKSLKYELPLSQINDILASSNNESKIYAAQIKKDFEVRRYWRKQFNKFTDFHKLL